ncbi:protein obstructor-E-like isoform X1 [Zophobas morio]|uniref:protein obstructor-E-like isoform X1 n=1 Tax=Zophobas morio TaxID=2755281 RepID=UPI0030830D8B
MKDFIISTTIVRLVVLFSFVCYAQWTPDPFCPYPYPDHATKYRYYGNCSVYWECYYGAKYIMECPEGLEFNEPLQQCDTPSIANCDPWASTTGNPDHTGSTDSTYSASSTRGPYPQCPCVLPVPR